MSDPVIGVVAIGACQLFSVAGPGEKLVASFQLQDRHVVLFRDVDADNVRLDRTVTDFIGGDEARCVLTHVNHFVLLCYFLDCYAAQTVCSQTNFEPRSQAADHIDARRSLHMQRESRAWHLVLAFLELSHGALHCRAGSGVTSLLSFVGSARRLGWQARSEYIGVPDQP